MQVVGSRATELAEHVARAFEEAGVTPASAAIESDFPMAPGISATIEKVLGIPCAMRIGESPAGGGF
jgi:predicted transcriptional regulator